MAEYQEVHQRSLYLIAAGLFVFGLLMALGAARAGRPDLSVMIVGCVAVFDAVWMIALWVRRGKLAEEENHSVD